jgi:hypothetical protein
MAGCCEHGNEPSVSIKCGEIFDWLSVLLASQEGLCSMALVSYIHNIIIHYYLLIHPFLFLTLPFYTSF